MDIIKSILGEIELAGEAGNWRISARTESPEPGLEFIHLELSSPKAATPPHLMLKWSTPQFDMQTRWHPTCHFNRYIPPDWGAPISSSLAVSAPVVQLINLKGRNRVLVALSEAMRQINLKCGIREEDKTVCFSAELFSMPEAPITAYELILRFDTRNLFYADALRSAFEWYSVFPEYVPTAVPQAAFDPIYSTWYSFHQNLFAGDLEKECALAREYGLKGMIVDDGWQTDDNNRGYAFCGDWEISKRRFPDMRAHVEKVHKLGLKYIVWFSVPYVGQKSKNAERFKGKYLFFFPRAKASVLDPRFPEVREFLISTYETALREWGIDGFKLDFIDIFRFDGVDPAVAENYAGRDIRSLPESVDRLLSDVMARLRAIKPEILIEFRQNYIGPAIRKYGNMFRSNDCPGDVLSNRIQTIDLRLSSGNTAVHSDMLEWNPGDAPENAALQILNILFSVPQISVRFADLPEPHCRMLHFWLNFWMEHRDTLLNGSLKPYHPELNYPVVSAESEKETVIAIYDSGQCVTIDCEKGKKIYVVNASGCSELILDVRRKPVSAECFDTMGETAPFSLPEAGLVRTAIPESGLLKLVF